MTVQHLTTSEARTPLWCALAYINRGWKVLPLAPGSKQPLSALVPNGFHGATADPETARRWWTAKPDAGIGLAMKDSGLVCVDVDARNGGLETLERLEAQHGPMQSDVMAYTPGGGMHFLFSAQLVGNLPGTLGAGIDLKADGYIAVEPSQHPNGKAYAWEASSDPLEGCVPSSLPGWIRDLVRAPLQAPAMPAATVPPMPAERRASLQQALGHIPADDRDTWLQVGMAIQNELPTAEGFDLWTQWSQHSPKFNPRDQLRVWRSFEPKGLAGVGVNTVFKMAQLAGWKNGPQPQEVSTDALVLNVHELYERAASVTWAVKGVVPERGLGFVFGANQTFKSFVVLDYAMHRCYGMNWMGRRTKKATPVYLAAEGGAGLMRRIQAWHQARGMDWRKCPMRVVIVPLTLRTQAGTLRKAIEATGVQPGDVIVDTMSQTFTGEENSNNDVADFLRVLGSELRDALGVSVLIVHHTGHTATERPRGASAIVDNADFAIGVFRDGKELLTTLEFVKVKDGERPDPQNFALSLEHLGSDSDGDPITSLAARHINNAEELLEAHKREGAVGRGGRGHALMELVQNGISERDLRLAFYSTLTDVKDTDAKKVAFYRARDWAVSAGYIEIAGKAGEPRTVIVLKDYK